MLDEIAAKVSEAESLPQCELRVLMAPTTGYDTATSKILVSLVSRKKSERVFIKISNSVNLSFLLEREAQSMSECIGLGITGIPQVLASGSIEGRYFLALKHVSWPRMHGGAGYLDTALAGTDSWLTNLYEKTQGSSVDSSWIVRRAEGFAKFASGFFDLSDCLALMEKIAPQGSIPTCRIHGDFWHGNILLDGVGGICVTDFAFSEPGEPRIDRLDLICDYDASIFLDADLFRRYSRLISAQPDDLHFLLLYALIRKAGLKADRRRRLYEEFLLNDLESSMNEINEVGIAKRVTRHHEFGRVSA